MSGELRLFQASHSATVTLYEQLHAASTLIYFRAAASLAAQLRAEADTELRRRADKGLPLQPGLVHGHAHLAAARAHGLALPGALQGAAGVVRGPEPVRRRPHRYGPDRVRAGPGAAVPRPIRHQLRSQNPRAAQLRPLQQHQQRPGVHVVGPW